jgi:hypothetical protein
MTLLTGGQLWQWAAVWVVEAMAVGYLLSRWFGRSARRGGSKKDPRTDTPDAPDVTVDALVRKKK